MKCPDCLKDTFLKNDMGPELQSCSNCRSQFIPVLIEFFNKGFLAALQQKGEIYSKRVCDYCEGKDACLACENFNGFIGRKLSPVR